MKLTPWFSVKEPPVRVGVYERYHDDDGPSCWQRWNGQYWGPVEFDAKRAASAEDFRSCYAFGQWRGISKDQE